MYEHHWSKSTFSNVELHHLNSIFKLPKSVARCNRRQALWLSTHGIQSSGSPIATPCCSPQQQLQGHLSLNEF
jgi:hypothetical protein